MAGQSETISLRFPSNLSDNAAFLVFTFKKHNGYTTIDASVSKGMRTGHNIDASPSTVVTGSIGLPFPNTEFSDESTSQWRDSDDQSLAMAGMENLLNMIPGGGKQYLQDLSGTSFERHSNQVYVKENAKAYTFRWQFIPKTEEEAITLKKIFRAFYEAKLPELNDKTGGLFSYPDVVFITAKGLDMKFLACVISSVKVDYTPNQKFESHVRTNLPPVVKFEVSLIEYTSRNRNIEKDLYNTK
jgi:hypothetical protein